MIWFKILNTIFIGLIFFTNLFENVECKVKKQYTSKSSSTNTATNTVRHSKTTPRTPTYPKQEAVNPHFKQQTHEVHTQQHGNANRYPTQHPGNTQHYPGQQQFPNQQYPNQQYPNQNYPHQQYPNQQFPNQHYPNQHYPNQQYPNQQFPNQHYPNQHYPNQQFPNTGHYPGHNPSIGNTHGTFFGKPKKKHSTAKSIATHVAAGLGGAYIGHKLSRSHSKWYERKREERRQHNERSFNKTTNHHGLARLTPVVPFKVNDIQQDHQAIAQSAGPISKMVYTAHNFYKNDEQKDDLVKAAEVNSYLLKKLRPLNSETAPIKHNLTTNEIYTYNTVMQNRNLIGGIGVNHTAVALLYSNATTPNSIDSSSSSPYFHDPSSSSTINSTFINSSTFRPNQGQHQHNQIEKRLPSLSELGFHNPPPGPDPQVLPLELHNLENDKELDTKRKFRKSSSESNKLSNRIFIVTMALILFKYY